MKPTRVQVFFATCWPVRIFVPLWLVGFPLVFTLVAGRLLIHTYTPFLNFWNLVLIVFNVLVAFILGFFVGLVALSMLVGLFYPVLRPLYRMRCAVNGAPFLVGDYVQILNGPHRGRIVRIYGFWQNNTVRVELGKEAEKAYRDIFDPLQVIRADPESVS